MLHKTLFLALLFAACGQPKPHQTFLENRVDTVFVAQPPVRVTDTVVVPDTFCAQKLLKLHKQADSLAFMKHEADSLYSRLLVSKYRLERVRFYTNIVARNPSQVKFLRGWINRALAE